MTTDTGFFIIPQDKGALVARILDGRIITGGKRIDIPFNSKSVITANGTIAALCFGNKPGKRRFKIFRPEPELDHRTPQEQDSPPDGGFPGRVAAEKHTGYKFDCIACKKNTVYAGGQYRKIRASCFRL
jgi:hypothetical protein